ncbi:MAG: ATP-binding protein [Hyphomicrobiaceae bacterium]
MRINPEAAVEAIFDHVKAIRFNSLAFRLFAVAGIWTLIVLPITGLIIYSANRSNEMQSFDGRLELLVYGIEAQNFGAKEPVKPENLGEVLFDHSNSGWYWQIQPLEENAGRRLVSDSLATSKLPSPYQLKVSPDDLDFRRVDVLGPLEQPLRILERIGRIGDPENGPRYSFLVAGPLDWPEQKIANFAFDMAIALAIAAIGLLIATFFQIRFGLFPLRTIKQGLADIRSGQSEKLDDEFPAEIEPLQVELNALIDSNQDIIDRARTQVGNLAHALKTPLAVITNEAGDNSSEFSRKVSEQAKVMHAQITNYLDRARVAARVGTIGRTTEIQPVIESLQRALERIHRDKGVSITVIGTEEIIFQGEQQDLEEMLGNLLDNACKWCTSSVRLTAQRKSQTTDSETNMMIIDVEDDGPGLTQQQRAKIGKRGLRLDESTPGSGLGLSIVTDLVTSYRGQLNLDASDLGGLKVRLELPTTPQPTT